jgi:drug/metabolite transporter (DMT)-like permease
VSNAVPGVSTPSRPVSSLADAAGKANSIIYATASLVNSRLCSHENPETVVRSLAVWMFGLSSLIIE